jgi:gentisate 1,2-dioxygenase
VEAVIYILQGKGYSVIDGVKYPWEAGDMICVPVFAWHRHHNESQEDLYYLAATTGPFSMATGIAIYEEEKYPEYWIFAQKGEEAMRTLIPGGGEMPPGGGVEIDQSRWKPEKRENDGVPTPAEIYYDQLSYAQEEEKRRRAGKVLVKGKELRFGSTPMGRVAYAVEPRLGYQVKLLSTLVAEIPPERRSGAHRHIYEETNYILAGEGYSIIEDQRYDWKKGDTLVIPVFAWHQHFNTGKETARFLVHTNRAAMESTGYVHTQQGEPANY